ncbi:MAG: 16S rRNA (cytidine(1402)-2'-O)-methyltransferase [Sporomusaceae bacterium]|nr:16S rRNA (cytidine(1402)-2'-O)-methyltransferase [Sporomusaceae bacterium]
MNQNQSGILYICGTPIGNLDDMTFRAVRVLQEATLIAAEDTRHTRKLLTHFAIHTPLVSYHEHNKASVGPQLIERLLAGETIAVVSDAGMPGICDPGADLVGLAIGAGIQVTPVPGANAALCALVASGLDTRSFLFAGFLPKTAKKRREVLSRLAGCEQTLLFYESPHRVKATLAELTRAFGPRPAVAGRELTKKFEQFVRGDLASLTEHFAVTEPRGEFTIVVAGQNGGAEPEPADPVEPADLALAVARLVEAGANKKDAIRKVASERGLSRREVYNSVLDDRD